MIVNQTLAANLQDKAQVESVRTDMRNIYHTWKQDRVDDKTGKTIPAYNLKVIRGHKLGEVQRKEEPDENGVKHAWFAESETHSHFIENNQTYSDDEISKHVGIEDWDHLLASSSFAQAIGVEKLRLLMLIFTRVGAEAGKGMRLKDEALINWGSFADHNPFEPHCNAHPNNYVVTFPAITEHHNLLAMLDFDIAFDWDSFVSTVWPNPDIYTDAENLQIQRDRFKT